MHLYVKFGLICCVSVNMFQVGKHKDETLNMAQQLRLVSESNLCEVKSKSVDWTICILCQNPSDDNFICTANNTNVAQQNTGWICKNCEKLMQL